VADFSAKLTENLQPAELVSRWGSLRCSYQ